MKVAVPAAVRGAAFAALLPLLADEINVKRIDVEASDAALVRLKGKPNFRALGKRFGAEVQAVAALRRDARTSDALLRLERGEGVSGRYQLEPGDVTVVREVVTDWPVASDGPFVVALDPTVSPELAREGLARELVSRIQRLRKDSGFEVTTGSRCRSAATPRCLMRPRASPTTFAAKRSPGSIRSAPRWPVRTAPRSSASTHTAPRSRYGAWETAGPFPAQQTSDGM